MIGGVKRALSYREADAIVDGIARQLTDIGLDAGQPVIISMHGCLEAPLTILGALRGGFIPSCCRYRRQFSRLPP